MSRYGEDERVIVLKSDGGSGRDIFDQFVGELVRDALKKRDHKDHDHDEHGKKIKAWRKPVNKEVVACWTLLLMAASPWIGLKMLTMYASLLGQYAGVLNQFVK